MRIDDEYLNTIVGGASILSATFINAISKAINTLMDFGRSIGTAIRYTKSGYVCKIK